MRNNLRSCRLEHGYTQIALSKKLGITVTQYQRIESGSSDGSLKLWIELKRILGNPIDVLIENTSI